MTDFPTLSQDLVTALQLKYAPVGVTLYRETDPLPPGLPFTEGKFKSYCQALVLAGEGRSLLLEKDQMGCKLGTAVLGFEQGRELEEFLDDGVLEKYGVGLYGSEEASAATIRQSLYLEPGKTRAVGIAPLSACTQTPQVVVFTANSEQVMWLLYAVNYDRGGRMDLPQSGGALGGCSDITALPLLQKIPNLTFLGLGCRLKTGLDPCHLMLGMAGSDLEATHRHIQDMAKPMAMLQKARAGG
jgi:uncharacterized protein (DUF169 family)